MPFASDEQRKGFFGNKVKIGSKTYELKPRQFVIPKIDLFPLFTKINHRIDSAIKNADTASTRIAAWNEKIRNAPIQEFVRKKAETELKKFASEGAIAKLKKNTFDLKQKLEKEKEGKQREYVIEGINEEIKKVETKLQRAELSATEELRMKYQLERGRQELRRQEVLEKHSSTLLRAAALRAGIGKLPEQTEKTLALLGTLILHAADLTQIDEAEQRIKEINEEIDKIKEKK